MAVVNKPTKQTADKKNTPPAQGKPFNLSEYLKGVKMEWHKVSWPTWPHIWSQVIVVIVMVSVMTFGLFLIDNIFRLVIAFITGSRP